MNRRPTRRGYADRIARVASHIAGHLDEVLDLERLASIACFSPFHFHRIYSAMTGETVAETVRRCRLQRAARQLVDSQRPIAAVAHSAGYASAAAFTRAFAVAYEMPPRAFRVRGAPPPATVLPSGGPVMNHAVSIETLPTRHLLALRLVGPYDGIGGAFGRLNAWTAARGLDSPEGRGCAIYLNDCFDGRGADLLTDVCIDVPPRTRGEGAFRMIALTGGRHAVLHHQGPYCELNGAYRWLYGDWLPRSGEEVADRSAFDAYLNDPRTLPPAQWRTDLCLPLLAR